VSATFLWLTSCPYLLASAVCRLPLLVLTPRQLPLFPPTARQLHLQAPSTSEVSSTVQTSNSMSTIPPRIAYSTFYHLCVDYSFSSTTSPRVDYSLYQHLLEIQCAIEHIYNEYGLWTAETWAMSADAQLCDSGQWTPRDEQWQLGHASTKSGLLMARIGSSIVSRTLRTFDPAT